MKENKHRFKINMPVLTIALLLIVLIAVIYIVLLKKTVSNNIIQTITELAEHDQRNIENNVQSSWNELEQLEGKFISYHCETITDIETQMNVECANSEFSHIYLVAEDGKVYTDKFVTYDPESDGQNGRIDILPLFENGEDRIVGRFDDKVTVAGLTKESIIYGIRLEDFSVEGIPMVALIGISNISNIQDRLVIDSFTKGDVSRGYSAVIDMNGNYIVNVERSVFLNNSDNFFGRIDNGVSSDLSSQEISDKMQAGETFSFYFTNREGKERIVYCMPFEDDDICWYFLSSVESTVFMEQNRMFLFMSLAMLVAVIIVIIMVLIFFMVSQNNVITARADAKARSSFLANMSHEIRTPLNGIIGLLFLLEKDIDGNQDKDIIRQRVVKAKGTAEYLLSLINNILDISKLQAGKVNLNYESISPELIVDDVWTMQRNNFENRGVELTIHKEMVTPWMIGDELMIKQILMNLLSNAAKFTPPGGRVTLSVRQEMEENGRVATTFICADTGCGMSEDFIEHIWDNFSQERSSNDESIKGTGLGMAISKLLIDIMDGEIRVESSLGEGTTFYVTLHSEVTEEEPKYLKKLNSIAEKASSHGGTGKILVAEDNELNAEILIDILENQKLEVIYAQNGQEAVDKFRSTKEGEICVILMDMQMPVMDGCEATKEIRNLNRIDAKKVAIFACTANTFSEDRERAAACGMDDFLTKPIDVDELLDKIEGVYCNLKQ